MACVAICAERASRVFTFPGQVALRIFVVELSRFKIFDNRVRADLANESGGERAAVQTLCEIRGAWPSRQRLDCGGFSTAFHHANSFLWPLDPARETVFAPLSYTGWETWQRSPIPRVTCSSTTQSSLI